MDIKKIEELLNEKIPRDVISERDGGGNRRLSYLEGWYVIDRLNKIFGPLGWSKEIVEIKEVVNTTKNGEFPAYLVKLRLNISISPDGDDPHIRVVKEAYGYGADKSGLNAHELAIKEAVTDALKVAAKDLGMSMGLALYDKTQENVSDEEPDTKPVPVQGKPKQSPAPKESKPAAPLAVEDSAETIENAIRSYVRVADKQKKLTPDAFKEYLKATHDADKLKDMSREKLKATLSYLQELTK